MLAQWAFCFAHETPMKRGT